MQDIHPILQYAEDPCNGRQRSGVVGLVDKLEALPEPSCICPVISGSDTG